jgi:hypothetical protein
VCVGRGRVESGEWSGEWRVEWGGSGEGSEGRGYLLSAARRLRPNRTTTTSDCGEGTITTTVAASGSLGAAQPRRLLSLHSGSTPPSTRPSTRPSWPLMPRPAFPAQPPPALRYRHQHYDQDTPRHLTLSGAVAYSRPSHPPNSKHVDSCLCFHAMAHDSALVDAVPCITRASVQTKLTHYHMFARLILNTDLSTSGLVPPTLGLAPPVRLVSVSPVYSHLMQHHTCTRLYSPS